jgi:hypothetical protein
MLSLEDGAACSFETSVTIYQSAGCNIPEDLYLQKLNCKTEDLEYAKCEFFHNNHRYEWFPINKSHLQMSEHWQLQNVLDTLVPQSF